MAVARLELRRPAGPNYTPSAPKLRLIATQVSDQIGASRVALRCVAGVVDVEPFREIRPGSPCRCRGRRQPGHHDGSPGPGNPTAAEAATPATQAAADSCLSAPKGATPSGSHWYYRIDRVTKRQCWYLREESDTADDKFARAAPPASARFGAVFGGSGTGVAAATNDHPQVDRRRTCRMGLPATPRRAKSARQSRAANGCGSPCTCRQNSPRATMPNVLAPAPLSSMRWNDAPTTRSLANPADLQVAAANPPADQPPQAEEVQQPAAADEVAPAARTRRRQSRPHRCRSCFW